jgi:hypothetical protein
MLDIKYAVGDKVWFSSTKDETRQHPCPDCLGKRSWKVIAPAGTEYDVSCPRCSASYQSNRSLNLSYNVYAPHVDQLTIGSVQTNTADDPDSRVKYMCVETGVGSGSVYKQSLLHKTREEAQVASEQICAIKNTTTPHIVECMKRSAEFSDYQLSNAVLESAKTLEMRINYRLSDFIGRIEYCETMDEVREEIEKIRKPEPEEQGI